MRKVVLYLMLFVLPAGLAYADTRCDNCMMKVKEDSPFRITVLFSDGERKDVCSLYCASMEVERAKDREAKITAVDYNTGEELDAKKAVWVEGGDIRPMMSDEARVAFRDRESAEAFVKEHGGHIASFEEVYDNSVKEWKER